MKNKKFVSTTFLSIINGLLTFPMRVDDLNEPSLADSIISTSTDLINICSNKNAQIKRTIEPNTVIGNEVIFHSESKNITYSGLTPFQITYSPTEGTFDLSSFPKFQLNFSSIDSFNPYLFGIKIMLSNFGKNPTLLATSPGLNQLPFDFTGNFKYFHTKPEEISEICIMFNSASEPVNFNFTLDSIELIPEPISMITLGSGITMLIRKRQKQTLKYSIN